jgi:cytidine deaminase
MIDLDHNIRLDVPGLLKKANEAREQAYAPYSKFKVGAVLLGSEGQTFYGCNVENIAYGPTNCAERTALFRAISDGYQPRSFQAIAIVADTPHPISPCGVCRQVMIELCRADMLVILGNVKGDYQLTTVSELLPSAFSELNQVSSNE